MDEKHFIRLLSKAYNDFINTNAVIEDDFDDLLARIMRKFVIDLLKTSLNRTILAGKKNITLIFHTFNL